MFNELNEKFKQDGEEATRQKVDQGLYSGVRLTAARAWLKSKERQRDSKERRRAPWKLFLIAGSGWVVAGIMVITLLLDKCSNGG
jgi:sensor domain CHASE-containing protein